ncbi:MAG TPA: hypothetical protein VGF23_17075 [Gaiellaceae bacterium]|jgi:hypothetical protein
MFQQPDLSAELVSERARTFHEEAAAMRMRPRRRVRHAAAVSLRRLADRLDGTPARLAAHGS